MFRQTRSTRGMLLRAAMATLAGMPVLGGRFYVPEPGEGGGAGGGGSGGSGNPPPAKPEPPKEPTSKLALTKEELEAQLEAARKEERDKLEREKKKAEEEAEKKRLEEEGKHKELAETEKSKREAAERENASLKVDIAIRDALADEKYREYVGCAKYIKPLIDLADAGDAAKLQKSISAAIEQYVKDNPRSASKGSLPPAPPRSGYRGDPQNPPKQAPQDAAERDAAFMARHFRGPARLQQPNNN